tara:strand:- start:2450 stop:3076 length:627 start_codon:yes stop_codon:yes gene_type:complete
MLIANNISIQFGEKKIFKNLDLSVRPKKIIQIRGRNGVGKTTLIKILANIMIPTTGEIFWNGKNIHKKNSIEYFKDLALVMETNTSKNDLTVYENIKFWKTLFNSSIQNTEIDSLLEMLNLQNNKKTFVKYLSYGEKRKLEISRLVIEKKKIWIFDEPYLGLDDATINIFNETLKNHIKTEGMVIFSSHYQLEVQGVDTIDLENYANN